MSTSWVCFFVFSSPHLKMFICFVPTGLPESLSVYFTGMGFIFLSLEGGGRMMRSRIVSSAFPKPTQILFCLQASASSASFSVSAFWPLQPVYLSQLSPIISHPLLCSFPFLSILFSDILSAVSALLFPPDLQFPLYFCPVCPLISFFSFKVLCDLSFLALWCTFSSTIVISSIFTLMFLSSPH